MAELESRYDIRIQAKRLIEVASVSGHLPTPVEELVAAADLVEDPSYEITDSIIAQMPRWLAEQLRSAKRKIKGVIDRRERIIYVEDSGNDAHQKYVKLHEVGHDILPWQNELSVTAETKQTLSPRIEQLFEQEANQCAADLFFQAGLLANIARDHPTDISSPFDLADTFGASRRATFRHWLEESDRCVCGFLLELEPSTGQWPMYKRLECPTSQTWTEHFGDGVFPPSLATNTYPFLAGLHPYGQINCEWSLLDLRGEAQTLRVQSACNTYNHFVLVWMPEKEPWLARLRKRPTLSSVAANR